MKSFLLIPLLALISSTTAINTFFACPHRLEGACCLRFKPGTLPGTGTGLLCGEATKQTSPNPSTTALTVWACLNNVDRISACCEKPLSTVPLKCTIPIIVDPLPPRSE